MSRSCWEDTATSHGQIKLLYLFNKPEENSMICKLGCNEYFVSMFIKTKPATQWKKTKLYNLNLTNCTSLYLEIDFTFPLNNLRNNQGYCD